MTTCPTCGAKMVATFAPLESLASAPLSHTARAIVSKLVAAYPKEVTRIEMVAAVQSAAPAGSANHITNSVRTLRPLLEKHGWTISKSNAVHGYRLMPAEVKKMKPVGVRS